MNTFLSLHLYWVWIVFSARSGLNNINLTYCIFVVKYVPTFRPRGIRSFKTKEYQMNSHQFAGRISFLSILALSASYVLPKYETGLIWLGVIILFMAICVLLYETNPNDKHQLLWFKRVIEEVCKSKDSERMDWMIRQVIDGISGNKSEPYGNFLQEFDEITKNIFRTHLYKRQQELRREISESKNLNSVLLATYRSKMAFLEMLEAYTSNRKDAVQEARQNQELVSWTKLSARFIEPRKRGSSLFLTTITFRFIIQKWWRK